MRDLRIVLCFTFLLPASTRAARPNSAASEPAIELETVFSGAYVEGKRGHSTIKGDFEREVEALMTGVLKEPRLERKVWAENGGNFLHTSHEWLLAPEQVYQRLKAFEASHPELHFNAKTPLGRGQVETQSPVRRALNTIELPSAERVQF